MVEDGAVLSDKWLVAPEAGVTPGLVEAGYDAAAFMGARMVRYHRGLEPVRPGALALYAARVDSWLADVERRGFDPYLTLAYQPDFWSLPPPGPARARFVERFGSFCGRAAARYAGRISRFGVWNEPNNRRWGGGLERRPELYGALFRDCAAAIRAVDPAAIVAFGEIDAHRAGACDYVERALSRPAVADALAIHTYQWTSPPELPAPGSAPCQGIGRLGDWELARRRWHDEGRLTAPAPAPPPPLWITEHGYCGPAGECPATTVANSLDEATRAEYAGRALRWARRRGVAVFGHYHLFTQPPGPGLWDSGILTRPALPDAPPTPTPSVFALRDAMHADPADPGDGLLFPAAPLVPPLHP